MQFVLDVSLISFQENESVHYPFRTSNYGDWSGLRVDLSVRSDLAVTEDSDGVIVIVQHPDQWPNSGFFIPSSSQTSVVIKPIYSYTTKDVRRLTPEERQCLNVSLSLLRDGKQFDHGYLRKMNLHAL